MEYPTLVTTGGDVDLPGLHLAEEVTVHEVGHNWFQGLLASNEVDEAFLDEGVNEYADGLVLDDWFGADRSTLDVPFAHVGYYEEHRARVDPTRLSTPIATPSYRFAPGEYGAATYGKMALVLKTLEQMAGRERFLAALGLYARRNAFRHPTRADLVSALRDGLGADWGWFLDPALDGRGGVDFRFQAIGREPLGEAGWRSEVTIENIGLLPAATEVEVRFGDGSVVLDRWDGRGGFHTFVYERAAPVVAATIDPDGKVWVEHERLANGWSELTVAPVARAAARVGFWEQTLEQLVGL
jgi:hypothetical protein